MSSHKNIFKFIICGTDTDIGKTLISSFFVKGLNSFYWKPIQSGIESQTDSQTVEKLAQVSNCLLYTSPSPRDGLLSRMPSSA